MTAYLEDIVEGHEMVTEPHTVTAADITSFSMLSGDRNPLQTDDVFAQSVGFRERVAHGLLVASVTSGLASERDEWAVNVSLEEHRRFRAPVYPGDTIRVVSRVTQVRRSSSDPSRGFVTIAVQVRNQDDTIVQEGTDVVMVGAREDA